MPSAQTQGPIQPSIKYAFHGVAQNFVALSAWAHFDARCARGQTGTPRQHRDRVRQYTTSDDATAVSTSVAADRYSRVDDGLPTDYGTIRLADGLDLNRVSVPSNRGMSIIECWVGDGDLGRTAFPPDRPRLAGRDAPPSSAIARVPPTVGGAAHARAVAWRRCLGDITATPVIFVDAPRSQTTAREQSVRRWGHDNKGCCA